MVVPDFKSKSLQPNDRGSVILPLVLVAGAVLAMVAYLLPRQFETAARSAQVRDVSFSAALVAENMTSMLDNEAVWIATLRGAKNSAKLLCLQTPNAVCTAAQFGEIAVYSATGEHVSGIDDNLGFDRAGRPCTTFKDVNDDRGCEFRFKVFWQCETNPCPPTLFEGGLTATQPRVQLVGQIEFSPRDPSLAGILNETNLQYLLNRSAAPFVRGARSKTLSKFCNSIGGIFDQAKSDCKASIAEPVEVDCGPGRWYMGSAPDGQPICANDINRGIWCPPGSAIVSYRPDGGLVCGFF